MDLLITVAVIVAVIAVLAAVVARSRRGQSSIGRESDYTVHEKKRKEPGNLPPPGL
jgi:hypothetical protein